MAPKLKKAAEKIAVEDLVMNETGQQPNHGCALLNDTEPPMEDQVETNVKILEGKKGAIKIEKKKKRRADNIL